MVDKIAKIARETPGILDTIEIAGFNLFGGNQPNTAAVFLPFKNFAERHTAETSMPAIVAKLNARVRAEIPEALVAVFPPPPVAGIGNAGGYRLFIQDRGNAGLEELQTQAFALTMKANQTPGLANNLTTFRANVPQLWLDVDRVKAKSMNVPLSNIFGTLQTYLGSAYVNDLTLFGRTYRVTAQADAEFRLKPEDIRLLKTRNTSRRDRAARIRFHRAGSQRRGQNYPLQHVPSRRPERPAGARAPARATPWPRSNGSRRKICRRASPPNGRRLRSSKSSPATARSTFSRSAFCSSSCCWRRFTRAGRCRSRSFSLCRCVCFSAIGGVWLRSMENNIFTQIGFVVLVGLACKNAILIVEFAKQIQDRDGKDRFTAAVEACRLRLRPILMTSFAFIFGVLPLVISSGAGAEMRQALGTAVFFGMLGVTGFGLFLTPVFYVVIMWFKERRSKMSAPAPTQSAPPMGAEPAV